MIEFKAALILIWLHFLADFMLQSDWIARNKSKDNWVLLLHAAIYTVPFLLFGWLFAVVNGIAHLVTDYFTSRMTSKLWAEGKTHWFFVVIGADQAIHISTLLMTYVLLG